MFFIRKIIPAVFIGDILKLFIILPLFLVACGDRDDATDTNAAVTTEESVSFNIPESILANKPTAGTLSATISVNGGTPRAMTISGDTATVTLSDIPTGMTSFTITFTFDHNLYEPLVIASATKSINVSKGDNNLSFAVADYDVSMDEDNDGRTNLQELDENSTSSPFVSVCVLGTGTLGNCEL